MFRKKKIPLSFRISPSNLIKHAPKGLVLGEAPAWAVQQMGEHGWYTLGRFYTLRQAESARDYMKGQNK